MEIEAPKFDLLQPVFLYWNDSIFSGKIVSRKYCPEKKRWEYELQGKKGKGKYYPEQNLKPWNQIKLANCT